MPATGCPRIASAAKCGQGRTQLGQRACDSTLPPFPNRNKSRISRERAAGRPAGRTDLLRKNGTAGGTRGSTLQPMFTHSSLDLPRTSKQTQSAFRIMKLNTPKNNLVGDMPKIGIRPAIDGRRA